MNKREAKREAWFLTAEVVMSSLDLGWPEAEYSPEDTIRVQAALREVVQMCLRRGWISKKQLAAIHGLEEG